MRIPGIGNLTKKAAQNRGMKLLKKAGIKKSKRVLKAEYLDYCADSNPTAKDKAGFLSVMNMLADTEAKEWIDGERARLDGIIEKEEAQT